MFSLIYAYHAHSSFNIINNLNLCKYLFSMILIKYNFFCSKQNYFHRVCLTIFNTKDFNEFDRMAVLKRNLLSPWNLRNYWP